MQKLLFGIFAHPDDEAFGLSPTFLKEVDEGAALHLITLTAGENGMNPDQAPNLAAVRLAEWRRGGELMNASSMHHLGYIDGTLANKDLLAISARIIDIVTTAIANSKDPVEFVVLDENGVTGHIDHIVATRAALHAFYTLKRQRPDQMSRVRLRCLARHDAPSPSIDWVYMNEGHSLEEIDETVDASEYSSKIVEVIRAHHSQRHDGESHIMNAGENLSLNYFIVRE